MTFDNVCVFARWECLPIFIASTFRSTFKTVFYFGSENISTCLSTGWQRCTGCLQSQVSFRKRATNYMALLRKITCKDKASYVSTPPCTYQPSENIFHFHSFLFPWHVWERSSVFAATRSCCFHDFRECLRNFRVAISSYFRNENTFLCSHSCAHERWGAGVEYHFQEFNEPYAPS